MEQGVIVDVLDRGVGPVVRAPPLDAQEFTVGVEITREQRRTRRGIGTITSRWSKAHSGGAIAVSRRIGVAGAAADAPLAARAAPACSIVRRVIVIPLPPPSPGASLSCAKMVSQDKRRLRA